MHSTNLSSQYLALKSSYHKSIKFKEKEFKENDDAQIIYSSQMCSSLSGLSSSNCSRMETNAESLSSLMIEVESISKNFDQELRVAGIRATRERLLLEKFGELMDAFKHVKTKFHHQVQESENQVHALEEQILSINDEWHLKCNQLEEINSNYDAKLTKEKKKLKDTLEELEISKKEKDSLMTRHAVELNTFLERFENEVYNIKKQYDIQMEELIARYETEKEEYLLKHLEHQTNVKNCTNDVLCLKQLDQEKSEASEKIKNNLIARIHDLEQSKIFYEKKCKDLEDDTQQLKRVHMEAIEKEKRCQHEMKERHHRELKEIENRVKEVVGTYTRQLQEENIRASKAEKKAKAFELCIKKLENGIHG